MKKESNVQEFDYVIVGGGTAGCLLANRLTSNRDIRVAMIEYGDANASKTMLSKTPIGVIGFLVPSLAFLGGGRMTYWFKSEPGKAMNNRRVDLPRGKGVGGCSIMNGLVFIRGNKADFDKWREGGCEGWGYDDLLPFFKSFEHFRLLVDPQTTPGIKIDDVPLAQAINSDFHSKEGELWVVPPRSPNLTCKAWLDAGKQAGYDLNPDFNGEKQDGVGYYALTLKNGLRHSGEEAFIRPIKARPNLTIIDKAKVKRILLENRYAVGACYDRGGEEYHVKARKDVILCAGTFHTPQILQLSGIGAVHDLQQHGIDVVHALPGVGHNLQDHPDLWLKYRSKTIAPWGVSDKALPRNVKDVFNWIFRKRGVFATSSAEVGGFFKTKSHLKQPDVQVFFNTSLGLAQEGESVSGHGWTIHICDLQPNTNGSITLAGIDPYAAPKINLNFFENGHTHEVLVEGIKIVRNIMKQPAFNAHVESEISPGETVQDDEALKEFVLNSTATVYHPTSSCRMGNDPMSVVDPKTMKVHGMEGLRIVDSSVMPTVVSGNTMAATYCIAAKAATLIQAT